MSGRGRSRKAKSPDAEHTKRKPRLDDIKEVPLPTRPDSTEEEQKKKKEEKKKTKTKTMTKMPPDTPKDTTQDYVEIDKAKACGAKPKRQVAKIANSPEKLRKTPNMPPGKGEDFTKDMTEKNPAVDDILKETLEKLKIKKTDKSNAALVINTTKDYIIKHLKKNTESFKEVQEPLPTGSYYENVKICNPDEFDIMVPILVERVEIKPFGDDGAFYSVALKRDKNPLKKFQENGHLSASNMLSEFREEVKKCVEKKKKGCPAVTLTTNVNSVPISLDVVLCLMVKSSWPSFTNEGLKIEGWLGTKVKQEYKRKPYYLVPKYEGRDVWRVSFSHVEKAILKNHGSEKTCCEKHGASCCRKSCLKLLKHLLHLLKESNPSFDKFCSYHVKTTLLHACCSRTRDSDWRPADLSHCFQLLLKDFENHLQKGQLQNFFIPSQNLLSGSGIKVCRILSSTIKQERQTGFPIFSEQLQNAH
uniref:Cyclic GMP-AMP synthase n=1 Tax=Amphilophus citrinellus TaxID=61819 RepID=A0A3Q0S5A1_AMPCI